MLVSKSIINSMHLTHRNFKYFGENISKKIKQKTNQSHFDDEN